MIKNNETNKNNLKQKENVFNNENYLYICKCEVDSYEYKKMVKYFPQVYWSYIIWGTLLNFIFTLIIAISSKNFIIILTFFIIYQIYIMVYYRIRLEYVSEKLFNFMKNKKKYDTKFHLVFYENYFIKKGEIETYEINYSDIDRCVETDTNFYLKYGKKNKIILIQKDYCDLELISFIRETLDNLENRLGDNSKFKGVKKYHDPNFIRKSMIILFVITILSLWGALYSMTLVDKINPQHGFNFTKNTWVFWCWLPISILSIILGFKYKNAGFKCTKNIIGGFIIGFLLLIYGSFWLFPTFSQDYSKIDAYRNIIDAEIPNNGELEIQNWGIYFDGDKTEYTIINAYYDKENVNNLVSSIRNSSNWILSEEIKSELKIFVPSQLRSDNDAYFSIYNKTTNEYNLLPNSSGDYEIYAIKYDISDKHLEIHKFKYSYK